MKKIKILTIGRNAEIAAVLLRLINSNQAWEGMLALNDEEAKKLFAKNTIDLVLLGSGIEEESERILREFFTTLKPGIIILQHFGGGSGLLKNEINEALAG